MNIMYSFRPLAVNGLAMHPIRLPDAAEDALQVAWWWYVVVVLQSFW